MSLTLDIHIIQSFPLSNLNRDDTGSPKDCLYGGSRRARISSQCIKRAVRLHPAFENRVHLANGDTGKRTKRLKDQLVKGLRQKKVDEAETIAEEAIRRLGLAFDKKKPEQTEYLLYLGTREIQELIERIAKPEVLNALAARGSSEAKGDPKGKKKSKVDVGLDVAAELKDIVGPARLQRRGYAADIALFGRMMADDKDMNVSASCQVAHAISTHAVETVFDYFTAVDDFNTQDSGASMLGIQELNSACYYRYANVSINDLFKNLGREEDTTIAAVLGFVEASVLAIPTGKQNSTAALTPPVYGRFVLRAMGSPWSLAGAYSNAIRAEADTTSSIEQRSIARLETHLANLYRVYGKEGVILDTAFDINLSDSPTLADLLKRLENELRRQLGA